MRHTLVILILFLTFGINLFADSKQEDKVELIISDPKKAEGSWGKEADEVEAFQDVKIFDDLSEENTKHRLEEARDFFNSSLAVYKATEKAIKEKKELHIKEKESNQQDKFEWQKKARESTLDKEYKRMSLEGRKKAVIELVKAMNALDKIENPDAITSPVFIDLKASIYREYIKHQFRLKNYNQSSEVLEMYIALGEQYEKEAEPHKLLAMCYESQKKQTSRYKKDSVSNEYKMLKNCHLLRFADLAYGVESNQFKRIEKKTVKFNPTVPNAMTGKDYAIACGFLKKDGNKESKEDKKEVLLKKDEIKDTSKK
ncbi:MAG TPA: hypothetical protein PKK42_25205 [Leptospiraceae bacterium]|nr:hypothetical protein [Leptospiraceae bacterium]